MTAPSCFYVHRNGNGQWLYNAQYNRVEFTHANLDDCSNFNFSQHRWIAPCDGRVHLSAQVHVYGLRTTNPVFGLKFILNSSPWAVGSTAPDGSDIFSPIGGVLYSSSTGNGAQGGDGWWSVCEGDAIELAVLTHSWNGVNSAQIDGHRAHTYWSGAFFPSGGA